jgi:mevalonate kinase
MVQKWHSNGKLMLTGEYLVLFGAKALAVPVKCGQSLEVREENGEPVFLFGTYVMGKPWFKASFNRNSFENSGSDNQKISSYLKEIFLAARSLNPEFLRNPKKLTAIATIDFPINWGLGSSSSLISNIAWWANVDPYALNRLVSRGSGYDIACARSQVPLLYSIREDVRTIEQVAFNPACLSNIWFVFLEKKEPTETNLSNTLRHINPSLAEIREISDISDAFLRAGSVSEISQLMKRHELIVSGALQKKTLQSLMFPDFEGTVKSLGAWGGDFCMAVSEKNESYVREYFEHKGLRTVLSYNDLVI